MAGQLKIGAAIALDGDEKFKKQLKDIEKSMSLTKAESRKLAAEFDSGADSIDALMAKGKLLNKQYDEQKQKVNIIASAVEKYENAQKEIATRISATTNELENAKKALQESTDKYGENAEETKRAQQRVDELTDGLKRQEAQQEKIQTSLNDWKTKQVNAETQLIKTEKVIKANNDAIKKLADNTRTAGERMQNFGQKVSDVSSKITDVGDKADKLGKNLTVGVSAPLVAIGTAGIKAFNEVDDGLDIIVSKTGATGEAMTKFEQIYKDIAGEINADFSDIGAAVGEINTRLGLQENALHDASIEFLKYARINGADVNTSVQLVTRAMADAGIESSEYTRVLDALTVAGQKSGISVDKLAESLAKYGAPMRTLGLDIEDSIALFAAWEKAGVNTEIAFSGMKKAIADWGKEGKDAKIEFANLLKVIKETPDAAEALSIATDAFGSKAANDLTDAIRGGRFEVEEYTKALETAGGTVESTYGEMIDGADDAAIATQQAKIALAEIGETIMTSAAPILQDLTGIIKSVAEWFDSLDDGTRKTIVQIAAIGVVAGPAISWFGKITKAVGTVTDGLGKGIKHVGTWIDELKGVGSATTSADTAMSTLSGSIGGVSASIIGVTGFVVAFGAAMIALDDYNYKQTSTYKANEKIKESFDFAADAAKQYAQEVAAVNPIDSLADLSGVTEDKKTKTAEAIKSIQDEITQISSVATTERRALTEKEVARIDELLKKIKSLSDEELEGMASGHEKYQKRVTASVKAFEGSAKEYSEKAKEWYATENSLYKERIQAIKDWESAQIESIEAANLSQEDYEKRIKEVSDVVAAKEREASEEHKKTTDIIISGQMDRSQSLDAFLKKTEEYNKKKNLLTAVQREMEKAQQQEDYDRYDELLQKYGAMLDENLKLEDEFNTDLSKTLDERTQVEIGAWLGSIQVAHENGIALTEEQEQNLALFLGVWDRLPDDMKSKMQETVEAIGYGLDDQGNLVKTSANGLTTIIRNEFGSKPFYDSMRYAGQNVIDGFRKGMEDRLSNLKGSASMLTGAVQTTMKKDLQIFSPSRVTRKLGGQTGEGFALGLLDETAEVEKASKMLIGIPEDAAEKLSMRASIADSHPTRTIEIGQTVSGTDMQTFAMLMVQAFHASGLTVQMDAKTVGYLTASAVGKQLGFNAKRGG